MQWISENWVTILLIGGMLAMHLFGHGRGGHGKSLRHSDRQNDDADGGPDGPGRA